MFHAMMQSMFHAQLPLLEKILRPVVVYLFLVLLLRIFGKRELAQLNPFDLVVLLSLSNTVQNAMIGDDNSVSGGLVGAFSLAPSTGWSSGCCIFRRRLSRLSPDASACLSAMAAWTTRRWHAS